MLASEIWLKKGIPNFIEKNYEGLDFFRVCFVNDAKVT